MVLVHLCLQIVILGSGAKYNRNITTNERAASVTLFHLVPSMTYSIKVAAKSNAGVGVFTEVQRVTMGSYISFSVSLLQLAPLLILTGGCESHCCSQKMGEVRVKGKRASHLLLQLIW